MSSRSWLFPVSTHLVLGACVVVLVGVVATGTGARQDASGEWAVKAPLAPRSLLTDVSARDGVLVAVGERGHVLVSGDAGASWAQADVPSKALLTGVFMQDAKLGWAVGHDDVVLRTTDGGATWERVNYAPDKERPLLDVWFADPQRGLAVGAYGQLLATRDGGTTWEARAVNGGDDFHLNQIAADQDGRLYLAAEAGNLYRSEDGGETWERLPSPYAGSFFGLLPLSDGSLLAFGLRGRLFRSPDQGRTWEPLQTGTEAMLTSAVELRDGRFVVAGLAGTLLWGNLASGTIRTQELPDRKGIVALTVANDKDLLLFGEGGVQRVEVAQR